MVGGVDSGRVAGGVQRGGGGKEVEWGGRVRACLGSFFLGLWLVKTPAEIRQSDAVV